MFGFCYFFFTYCYTTESRFNRIVNIDRSRQRNFAIRIYYDRHETVMQDLVWQDLECTWHWTVTLLLSVAQNGSFIEVKFAVVSVGVHLLDNNDLIQLRQTLAAKCH